MRARPRQVSRSGAGQRGDGVGEKVLHASRTSRLEAKLEDMKKGQQAQVEYVERNERNRARSVRLFEAGGGSQDDQGGEKTG